MQTFENILLQNCTTKFLYITYKYSLSICYQSLFKWWRHLHYWRNNSQRQFEHRKFDAKFDKWKLILSNKEDNNNNNIDINNNKNTVKPYILAAIYFGVFTSSEI